MADDGIREGTVLYGIVEQLAEASYIAEVNAILDLNGGIEMPKEFRDELLRVALETVIVQQRTAADFSGTAAFLVSIWQRGPPASRRRQV